MTTLTHTTLEKLQNATYRITPFSQIDINAVVDEGNAVAVNAYLLAARDDEFQRGEKKILRSYGFPAPMLADHLWSDWAIRQVLGDAPLPTHDRIRLIEGLGERGAGYAKAQNTLDLIATGRIHSDAPLSIRLAAIHALGGFPDEKTAAALFSCFASDDPAVVTAASDVLADKMPTSVLHDLLKSPHIFKNQSANLEVAGLNLLIGTDIAGNLNKLVEYFKIPNCYRRAHDLLSGLCENQDVHSKLAALYSSEHQLSANHLDDPFRDRVSIAILGVLASYQTVHASHVNAIALLFNCLTTPPAGEDDDSQAAKFAAAELAGLGSAVHERLVDLIGKNPPLGDRETELCLQAMGLHSAQAQADALLFYDKKQPHSQRMSALHGLYANQDPQDRQGVLQIAIDQLDSPYPAQPHLALDALVARGNASLLALEQALMTPHADALRAFGIEVALQIASASSVDLLLRWAPSYTPEQLRHVTLALAKLDPRVVRMPLFNGLGLDHPKSRVMSAAALANADPYDTEAVTAILQRIFEPAPVELQEQLLTVLGSMHGPDGLNALQTIVVLHPQGELKQLAHQIIEQKNSNL